MKKKELRSQKGAISVFVMVAMVFFLVTIMGIYMVSSKRAQTQTQSVGVAQGQYYEEGEETEKYNERINTSDEVIPIYTKEQLWSVGSGNAVEIEGTVYEFLSSASYKLQNDIVINLSEYNNIDIDTIKNVYNNSDYRIIIYGDEENSNFDTIKKDKFYSVIYNNEDKIVYQRLNGPEYGDKIESFYAVLYLSTNPQIAIKKTTEADNYYNGSFEYGKSLYNAISSRGEFLTNTTTNLTGYEMIYSGSNTLTFNQLVEKNRWISLRIHNGYATGTVALSKLKLVFDDGMEGTISELADRDYIEKLVIATANDNTGAYLFNNFTNLIDGGETIGNYADGCVFLKVKEKSNLRSMNITSSKTFDTNYKRDGIQVLMYPEDVEISITPFK